MYTSGSVEAGDSNAYSYQLSENGFQQHILGVEIGIKYYLIPASKSCSRGEQLKRVLTM